MKRSDRLRSRFGYSEQNNLVMNPTGLETRCGSSPRFHRFQPMGMGQLCPGCRMAGSRPAVVARLDSFPRLSLMGIHGTGMAAMKPCE